MATYLWSSLSDGQTIAFNPTVDVLNIDDPAKSAADIFALVLSTDLSHLTLLDFGLNEDQDKTVTLQMDPRKVTQTNITFADGSVLIIGDNTTGTANDDSANALVGGIRDDQLLGLGGADSLAGGDGDDYLQGGLGHDTIVGGNGDDFLSDTDSSFDSNFQLIGGGDDSLVGGAGSDVFVDIWGNNVLDGGDGADFFVAFALTGGSRATGGLGQDAYILSGANYTDFYGPTYYEALDFQGAAGGDLLQIGGLLWLSAENGFYQGGNPFSQSFIRVIQSGVDTLVQFDEDGAAGAASTWNTQITLKNLTVSSITEDNITGLVTGGDGDDTLAGGAGSDAIFAGGGRDTLDGGAGADSMRGGAGADLYYVDDRADVVAETSNALALAVGALPSDLTGAVDDLIDTVIAAVTYSLENADYVENLTLAAGSIATAGTGNPLANALTGNALNNTFRGLAGNDTIDGGGGADTAVYSGNRSAYTIGGARTSISGPDGADTLSSIERFQFSDKSLAFDMTVSEAGGKTALLLGACLGKDGLNDKATVGAVLDYFDGGYTLTDAATLLVGAGVVAQLAGGADNQHFVDWIYLNVVDALPDAATEAALIEYITSGQFTQATFLATVAALQINQDHIGLVGMQQSGVEFI